ncbi:NUDIX hydrolase [Microbulbifer sp. S227A]|uniref:NUDIX hydrolase n=1 Tax=Microbulbifer sp. S227A TaxID=3415131 RepID=UPI003C7B6F78
MSSVFQTVWEFFPGPLLQRPRKLQIGALCHRGDGSDREYLLVTSRDTGRWIIPKGWPIRGLKSQETALREAWEEAGVTGSKVVDEPIGLYTYDKQHDTGWATPVETLVYSVAVGGLMSAFPEAHERRRVWVDAATAAEMVQEEELKQIFLREHANNTGQS